MARDIPLFSPGTMELWQRREMVVAVLDDRCPECDGIRAELAQHQERWAKEEVGCVFLRAGSDRANEFSMEPALIIANRFGQFYAELPIHGRQPGASVSEALEWVDLAQRQCGECQAPLQWS